MKHDENVIFERVYPLKKNILGAWLRIWKRRKDQTFVDLSSSIYVPYRINLMEI